jgi:hypothetical protein
MKTYDGSNQSIVVIDTGYNSAYKYPGEIVYEYDFADKDESAAAYKNNHGSQVAQIASKEAVGADIIHLKVFGDGAWFAGGNDIQDALQWTIDNAEKYNISAVNMSLGYGNATETSDTFLKDEFARLADKGVLITTAAGNSYQHYGEGVTHFSADVNTIAVSATDQNGDIASWSQHDRKLTDIFAQGDNVAVDNVNGTHNVDGTSFAAPNIAGKIAVVQEAAEDIVGHKLSQERMVDLMQMTGTSMIKSSEAATGTETDQSADGKALGADSQITQIKMSGAFYTGDVVSVNIDDTQYDTKVVIGGGSNFLQALDQVSKTVMDTGSVDSVSIEHVNYGTASWYANLNVEFKDSNAHDVSISATDNTPWGNPTPITVSASTVREAVGEVTPDPVEDPVSIPPEEPVAEEPVEEVVEEVTQEPVIEQPKATEPVEEVVEEKPTVDASDPRVALDEAGDDFETAKVLGVIKNDYVTQDHLVLDLDAEDTFRFTIGDQNVNISVETNNNDIDLELYNSEGVMIDNDWNWGGDDVNIDRFLFEGQYYAKVVNFDHDQEADYNLRFDLNREPAAPEVEQEYAGYVIPDTQKMVDFIGQKYDGWDGWLFV